MTRACLIFFATILASPAFAEGLTGQLRLGVTDNGTQSDVTVFADLDWVLRFGQAGLSVGSYGLWTEDSHPHETYATLFVDLGPGRLSAGVPRPAYDQFAVAAVDHAFPALGITALPTTRSHATAIAADGAGVPLGVMYNGKTGAVGWAASAHDIDRTDTQLLSFGTVIHGDGWQLSLATELVDGPDDTDTNAKLQAGMDLGPAEVTASYFHGGAQPGSNLTEFAAALPVSDRLEASIFTLLPTTDPEDGYLGASARYGLGHNIVLDGAAAYGDGDMWLGASIGLKF